MWRFIRAVYYESMEIKDILIYRYPVELLELPKRVSLHKLHDRREAQPRDALMTATHQARG